MEHEGIVAIPATDLARMPGNLCSHCARFEYKNEHLAANSIMQSCNRDEWGCMKPESIVWMDKVKAAILRLEGKI